MLSAAILVGGQSRRLGGRDKRALVVDGRLILDRPITERSAVADELLMVGGCAAGARTARARAVADRLPGCGPLGGRHAALTEAASDVIVVVACDMPYVSAPLLAYMLRLAGEADAVVPHTDRGYHPLCAVHTRGCAAAVGRHITEHRLELTEPGLGVAHPRRHRARNRRLRRHGSTIGEREHAGRACVSRNAAQSRRAIVSRAYRRSLTAATRCRHDSHGSRPGSRFRR
jgi:molybdenum cofactor guanylyltransferase